MLLYHVLINSRKDLKCVWPNGKVKGFGEPQLLVLTVPLTHQVTLGKKTTITSGHQFPYLQHNGNSRDDLNL